MDRKPIEVYCGSGHGKTTMAIGQCLAAYTEKKNVIIIQFLKGKDHRRMDFLEKLGNDQIKIFRFEKYEKVYEELTEEEKKEESFHIQNGLNFARKVIATDECDLLILDEILGVVDVGIADCAAIQSLLKMKSDSMHIIMTGRVFPQELCSATDSLTTITTQEF